MLIFAHLCFLVPLRSQGEERRWPSNNLLKERQSDFVKIRNIYKIYYIIKIYFLKKSCSDVLLRSAFF